MNTMRNARIPSVLFVFFFFYSCSTLQNSPPSQIGLLPLTGYRYLPANMITDTVYRLYQREETFNNQFAATAENIRRPGFTGQWVVAVLLPATATKPLRFEKAETVGKAVNVYATTCTGDDCPANQAVLATIPKVGNANTVRFFINGEQKNTVEL